jgi:hypothetical protein
MTGTATDLDLNSTLIRRGVRATTVSDMTEFVATLEERPLDRLLADIPGLSLLSDTKFALARVVLRRRLRELPVVEREQLRLFAAEVAGGAKPDVAERIRALFERVG